MKLLEYQGKMLFEASGIPVPQGRVVTEAKEALEVAKAIGSEVALKVQVPVGGRGKAGGIKLASGDQIAEEAEKLLAMKIKDYQVEKLLVEEKVEAEQELYLGLVVDTDSGNIIILFSPEGGVDIEEVASRSPEKVFRLVINPLDIPPRYRLRYFIRQSGFKGKMLEKLTTITGQLLHLALKKDLLTAEINPLMIMADGRVLAGDSKVEVDDNALTRQDFEKNFWDEQDKLEQEARDIGVTYVKLNGEVGVIASGAGLAMTTMDLLEEAGYNPSNFLETGGGITEDLLYKSFKLVCKNEQVKGVIINLYGGVNPIEKGAKGVVRALQEMDNPPVVVAKALGNKQEECWEVFRDGGVTVVTDVETETAVKAMIEALKNQ